LLLVVGLDTVDAVSGDARLTTPATTEEWSILGDENWRGDGGWLVKERRNGGVFFFCAWDDGCGGRCLGGKANIE